MNLEKNPSTGKVLELFGPIVEFLTSPQNVQSDFCILRGIYRGVYVLFHSHADTEDFFIIFGKLDCLRKYYEDHRWIKANTGDYIHVLSNSRHAWLNISGSFTAIHILTTKKMGPLF